MKQLPLQLKKRLAIAITLVFVFAIVGAATAQEVQRTYTLINPSISHNIGPGEKVEGSTKIINQASTPLTFKVGVQDYVVVDNQGTPNLLPPNTLSNKYSAASWIGVTPSQFTLQPGATQTVNYYIQLPFDARPGGHYAAIVYEPINEDTTKQTGGSVNTQIGSLFYITVKGPVKESGSVSKFFTDSLHEYGPIKILTQISNMSDLHIMPKGKITVSGLFFKESQELSNRNIFPETKRDYENTFGSLFMLGQYKADLTATYGTNNNLPLVASLTFWVFPWRLLVIIVLLAIAIFLGVTYMKKRRKNSSGPHSEPKQEPEMTSEK